MEIIAVLDAAVILYLTNSGTATSREISEFLDGQGISISTNYAALVLRSLQKKKMVEQAGSYRRPGELGAPANLWKLTARGKKEASELSDLFGTLLEAKLLARV